MPVISAYLTIIMIWSTSPLAIQWSGQGVGYEFGVAARMLVGLLALLLIVRLWHLPLPWDRQNLKVYAAGGLPVFLAMSSVYWSAQYIPSGWISVIFGLTPFFTSLFSSLLLGTRSFTLAKTLGMLLALCGLTLVFNESLSIELNAWWGVAGVIFSSVIHSLGGVLLKKLNPELPAISVTTGSLIIATPLFVLNSLLYGLPDFVPLQTLGAILYLAVMGTALGFPLYFYCLRNLPAEKVALITFITPVSALFIGHWINHESIGLSIWLGTGLILSGLAIYQYARYLPWYKRFRLSTEDIIRSESR